jgi:carboxypeptidase Taq
MPKTLEKSYKELMSRAKDLTVFQSAGAILYWDMETMMPPRGIELKSQQLGMIQKIGHQMLTDPENGKLIHRIESAKEFESLNLYQKRNLHLVRKAYLEAIKLPEELVVETAKQTTIGVSVWKKAKAAKDWSKFKPELVKIKKLREKAAELLMDVKEVKTPYDALLDDYEPKMKASIITKLFDEMKIGLIKLMEKISSSDKPETSFLKRPISTNNQKKIAQSILTFIEYDVNSEEAGGRIDTTEHPFTTGYYTDVRITTKYHEKQFASSIYSILHEGGHALYEQGLPLDWMYQPIGTACSNGIHESMSRFVENIVGRSPEFWDFFMPILIKLTGDIFKDVSKPQMIKAMNCVTPSKIRIEADEVTYGLHIIIRFEIERDLFNGDLEIEDLPQVWNQKYEDYLGVKIENDSEGIMQDTHWAGGSFGYFPSYAFGNLYDGMWLSKLEADLPDWRKYVSGGNFREIKTWLTENVYRYGNLYDPEDLVKVVLSKALNVKSFISYLDNKFQNIYGY